MRKTRNRATKARATALVALCASGLAVALPASAPTSPAPTDTGASDFTQPLPEFEDARARAHAHGGEEPDDVHRTGVIEAPARFDVAGIAGEVRSYELRGRERGGAWTDWTETANGDPVWFGGMDELQVRAHGFEPAGELHYVAVPRAEAAFDSTARAGATDPPAHVSRRAWGANAEEGGCIPRQDPTYANVKAAVVHHTVNAVDYSKAQAPGMVLAICRFHRNGNGWDDLGYNAIVDRFGTIYEGRAGGLHRAVQGAHAQGFNAQTTGVALLGTHSSVKASKRAVRGVVRFLAWKLPNHGKPAKGRPTLTSAGGSASRYGAGEKVKVPRIMGHRKVGLTDCPGRELDDQVPQIRRRTQRRIERQGSDTSGGSGGAGGYRSVAGGIGPG